MGQALLAAGHAARAIPFLEEAAKREPREWRYPYSLAQAWQRASDAALAIRIYQRARTLAPEQASILYGLGEANSAQGDRAAAAAAFRQASTRDPESADGPAMLGHTRGVNPLKPGSNSKRPCASPRICSKVTSRWANSCWPPANGSAPLAHLKRAVESSDARVSGAARRLLDGHRP